MYRIEQLVLATVLATSCSFSHAFDGDRRGFMLGVGGGLHSTDVDVGRTRFNDFSTSDSESGVQLRLTIGGGVNERFMLHGIYDIGLDDDAGYGLLGPGATFYFRGNGPSAYLIGGAGFGFVSNFDDTRSSSNYRGDYELATGFGLMFGGGYAFTQGFHVDGSLMYLDVTDNENFAADIDYELTSLRVTAGYTWF